MPRFETPALSSSGRFFRSGPRRVSRNSHNHSLPSGATSLNWYCLSIRAIIRQIVWMLSMMLQDMDSFIVYNKEQRELDTWPLAALSLSFISCILSLLKRQYFQVLGKLIFISPSRPTW